MRMSDWSSDVCSSDLPQSVQRGVALLELAAPNVPPYSWSTLGELHINGAFPGADPAAGIEYLQRAHQAGIISATAHLGQAYLEGRGVPKDPEKAIPMLKRAAAAGHPGAMMALGPGYLEGDVLPRPPDRATQWLEKADAGGVSSARLMLGGPLLPGEIPSEPAGAIDRRSGVSGKGVEVR